MIRGNNIYVKFRWLLISGDFYIPGPWPQFNKMTFEIPSIPLLTQKEEITSDMYCTPEDDSAKDCSGDYCVCPIIYTLPINSLVEVVIVDESKFILHFTRTVDKKKKQNKNNK